MRDFNTPTEPQTTARALLLIQRQPVTLEFTLAIIVNREQLTNALRDVRHVSDILHNIESLNDLSWEEMSDLCRTAYRAAQILAAMVEAKEVAAR